MAQLKIATFNIEWMVSLFFKNQARIRQTFPGRKLGPIRLAPIADVPALCRRIARVIQDVQPDLLGIQEGPPLKSQMERFVRDYLHDQYAVFTSNRRDQTIHALVKHPLSENASQLAPAGSKMQLLNNSFYYYPWRGYRQQDRRRHSFYRVPLVLRLRLPANKELCCIVVHTKSKISRLKTRRQWEERQEGPVLDALDSRQKLSAEVVRLRKFLDQELHGAPQEKALAVIGDFNDGPFRDVMEEEFLLHNIVDELVGSILEPDSFLRHAMSADLLRSAATTRFRSPLDEGQMVEELIDHILVSPGIVAGNSGIRLLADSCKVERAAYNAHNEDTDQTNDRGLRPSDHLPLSAMLSY